ncbi:MAG: hypothetical protein DRJ38_09720 [Thermoprotei archaeon]|nr:MAG: hypothetical protein DRJ38_09720 [Thermoprotei archaeon]
MFKVVSLDFGGTIAHEIEQDYVVYHKVLNELGYSINLNLVEKALRDARAWWREEKAKTGRVWNMKAYVELIERVLKALELPTEKTVDFLKILPHRIRFRVYDDVKPTLEELKRRGYRLIVISNVSSLKNLSIYISSIGLKDYFELLIASGTVGFEKPDPRIFKLALEKTNVSPGEMIHVGDDYEADYIGAENAGLTGVLLDRKNVYKDKNCRKIMKLTELLDLLT